MYDKTGRTNVTSSVDTSSGPGRRRPRGGRGSPRPPSSSGAGDRDRWDVEDLDETLEEVALAGDVDHSALERLERVEVAREQGMQRHVRLDDQVRPRERAFVDLEPSVVYARVDDDLAEAELVAHS